MARQPAGRGKNTNGGDGVGVFNFPQRPGEDGGLFDVMGFNFPL
jgi:hypothetical protein